MAVGDDDRANVFATNARREDVVFERRRVTGAARVDHEPRRIVRRHKVRVGEPVPKRMNDALARLERRTLRGATGSEQREQQEKAER